MEAFSVKYSICYINAVPPTSSFFLKKYLIWKNIYSDIRFIYKPKIVFTLAYFQHALTPISLF